MSEPAANIVNTSKAERCDLIVMGSHGHTALQTLFVGSVTAKVIAQGDVPLVVAR